MWDRGTVSGSGSDRLDWEDGVRDSSHEPGKSVRLESHPGETDRDFEGVEDPFLPRTDSVPTRKEDGEGPGSWWT